VADLGLSVTHVHSGYHRVYKISGFKFCFFWGWGGWGAAARQPPPLLGVPINPAYLSKPQFSIVCVGGVGVHWKTDSPLALVGLGESSHVTSLASTTCYSTPLKFSSSREAILMLTLTWKGFWNLTSEAEGWFVSSQRAVTIQWQWNKDYQVRAALGSAGTQQVYMEFRFLWYKACDLYIGCL